MSNGLDRAPVPGIDTGKALRFPDQARFHPTKYLAGLARAILARGGRIYTRYGVPDPRRGESGGRNHDRTRRRPRGRRRVRDQLPGQQQGDNPHQAAAAPDLRDRRARAQGIGARRSRLGYARCLPLCSHTAGERQRGSADRRRRGSPVGPGLGHGAAPRQPRIMDARALSRFRVRRVSLVGSGHGADRLHAVLGAQSGQPQHLCSYRQFRRGDHQRRWPAA